MLSEHQLGGVVDMNNTLIVTGGSTVNLHLYKISFISPHSLVWYILSDFYG
jgi:hypothetical protein